MDLYHIHKNGIHDNLWRTGNVINVTSNFESAMYKRYANFSVTNNKELIYMKFVKTLKKISTTSLNDKELLRLFKEVLPMGFDVAYYSNLFKRETALENYRLDHYSKLPSRLHSIFLTDEASLNYWIKTLGDEKASIYRIDLANDPFKTNEDFIPNELLNYEDTYNSASKYWNPKAKNMSENHNEYLYQGKVKILEKIK